MKLTVSKRTKEKKSALTTIRMEGNIPAILYKQGKEGIALVVDGKEYAACQRAMKKGHLPSTRFELDVEGKKVTAIVKEIQYHPTTYTVLHIDFFELKPGHLVTLNIPLEFVGEEKSTGVKLGGFLRPVRRHLKVCCLPEHIPSTIVVDVSMLGLDQSRRVREIGIDTNLKCLFPDNEAVAVITKR